MPTIKIKNAGCEFECDPGERILDAALRQGVHLPHNCRGGACGSCKSKVLEGEVDQGWVMSFGISDEETAEGFRLLCMSTAASETVTLDVLGEMHADDPTPEALTARLVAKDVVGRGVRRLTLDIGESFRFIRGQHVELGEEASAGGRPYSIADAPDARGFAPSGLLRLYVARYEDGVTSQWLSDETRVGEMLRVRGPYGSFGRRVSQPELLLLAGGTGFSPLHSIAEDLLANGHAGRVRFVLSARSRDDLVGLDALVRLQRAYANFEWTAAVTREEDSPWLVGRLPAHLASGRVSCGPKTQVLIAGPPAFTEDCAAAATTAGVPSEDIEVESYTPRLSATLGAELSNLVQHRCV